MWCQPKILGRENQQSVGGKTDRGKLLAQRWWTGREKSTTWCGICFEDQGSDLQPFGKRLVFVPVIDGGVDMDRCRPSTIQFKSADPCNR